METLNIYFSFIENRMYISQYKLQIKYIKEWFIG